MARYKEVRDILAGEIASGVHRVGAKFPTEYELCDRFDVSRHTVREALRALQDGGVLSRQAGSGTTVIAPGPASVYTQQADSLAELFDYAASDTRFEKRHEGIVTLRQSLAELLGRSIGERWLRFAGIRWLLAEPVAVCWTEIFIAEPYIAIRDEGMDARGPIYGRIEKRFGIQVSEVEQRTSAIAMPADIAAPLGATADAPALLNRRRYFANAPDPFEISLSLHPGDRYAHTQRLHREPAQRAKGARA